MTVFFSSDRKHRIIIVDEAAKIFEKSDIVFSLASCHKDCQRIDARLFVARGISSWIDTYHNYGKVVVFDRDIFSQGNFLYFFTFLLIYGGFGVFGLGSWIGFGGWRVGDFTWRGFGPMVWGLPSILGCIYKHIKEKPWEKTLRISLHRLKWWHLLFLGETQFIVVSSATLCINTQHGTFWDKNFSIPISQATIYIFPKPKGSQKGYIMERSLVKSLP